MPDASTAVAATGICFGISTLAFLMAYGIGAAAAIRVSNELGETHTRPGTLALCLAE
jgi:Na+-driven multidrug efflux pump